MDRAVGKKGERKGRDRYIECRSERRWVER